jgi:hypothetical protein
MTDTTQTPTTAMIEADADVPIIRITRDFAATPGQEVAARLSGAGE